MLLAAQLTKSECWPRPATALPETATFGKTLQDATCNDSFPKPSITGNMPVTLGDRERE
jgi:hypothetical protein